MRNPASMTPERWQRLQALFDQALTLEPAARAEFVATACGDDVALREQLFSLLLASAGDDEHFEQRVDRAIASSLLRDGELPPGQSIGRYRIVRLIGRGGMGAVYLAERADREFEQRVAIKVVADGLSSSRIVARLRTERQILANLNHPNIARLLDGGATAEGTPYLVMEYVAGQRIDRYCEDRRLAVAARLRLFQQVCAAVQYAHQSLVVHRDIKPSNILVTDEGIPKLLDFGIAKLLDPNATAQMLALTRVHERVLTPEHASPEQVRGESVGTATDIYALGVLLYELLTGLKPYNFNGLSFEQMERAICEQAPQKPSAAVLAASRLEIPTADPALAKVLHGDLDTIIMKAMHKEAQRRYASAGTLADDIGNFLGNRPIAARPDSVRYRVAKFLQRNRWSVASAAAVFAIVVALTVFYTWRLIAERDTAERERQTAQATSAFMQELFAQADPAEARGDVRVREVLDAAVQRIDTELIEQPRVRADLMRAMASSYRGLGLWRESLKLTEDVERLERASFGNEHAQLISVLELKADNYFVLNRMESALAAIDEAWRLRLHLGLANNEAAVKLLQHRANVLRMMARHEQALHDLERAQALLDELVDASPLRQAGLAHVRAAVYGALGRHAEAEREARRCLELLPPTDRGEVLNLRENALESLAQSLRRLLRLDDAERIYRELLARQLARFPADAPLIARTRNNLSNILTAAGRYADAEHELRAAIAIFDKRLSHDNLDSATGYHNLGALLREAGRLAQAERELAKALELRRKLDGDDSPLLVTTLAESAAVAMERGRFETAAQRLDEALRIANAKLPRADPRHAALALTRGKLAVFTRNWALAEVALREALSNYQAADFRNAAQVQFWLGELALRRGRPCDALEPLHAALAIRKELLPAAHWHIASTHNSLAASMMACTDREAGRRLLAVSTEELVRLRPADDYFVRLARARLRQFKALPAPASTTP